MDEQKEKDAGFVEEAQILADIERKIEAEAEKSERKWESLSSEIDDFFVLDSEDRQKNGSSSKKNIKQSKMRCSFVLISQARIMDAWIWRRRVKYILEKRA